MNTEIVISLLLQLLTVVMFGALLVAADNIINTVTIQSGDRCGVNVQIRLARESMNATSPDYLANYVSNIAYSKDALPLEFPWQVRIHIVGYQDGYYYSCGGAVVDKFWVITSAQCAMFADSFEQITAIFGLEDLSKRNYREFAIGASAAYIHQRYNPVNYDFDFAMIKMSAAINFTHVQPICLPESCLPEDSCQPGDTAIATGWGIRGGIFLDNAVLPMLRKDIVQLTSDIACRFADPTQETATSRYKWCAAQQGKPLPTCAGDDGGPLVCLKKIKRKTGGTEYYYQLAGITSWSYHTGCSQFAITRMRSIYQGFGRVCSVSDWIKKIINNFK